MRTKFIGLFISCFFCIYGQGVVAQVPSVSQGESTFEYTKRMYREVEALKNIAPEVFAREIDHFREQMERYIFHKKRVCNGEFSTFALAPNEAIINTVDSGPHMQRKLNPEEKKLCFKELKAFEVTYINNLFTSRRRYLDYLHELRTKELDQAREEALNSIKRSFAWP
ncbi:MAG: hypothetical protein HYV97_08865 [Bdellovibrio sp.]|nr:hypothetical protein [Bdellovibrio sp.]